jgi:hypothetical protein
MRWSLQHAAVATLALAIMCSANAVQDVTIRGADALLVDHLLPPASTRVWRGMQRLISSPDPTSLTVEKSGDLALVAVGAPQVVNGRKEQRFISKDRLIRTGSMGTIVTRNGSPAYQVNIWLDSRLICIPKHEVMRVFGPGENRRPFPPELIDSQPNGADEKTPADGFYHVSTYKVAAGAMEISFLPSGCVDGVSLIHEMN